MATTGERPLRCPQCGQPLDATAVRLAINGLYYHRPCAVYATQELLAAEGSERYERVRRNRRVLGWSAAAAMVCGGILLGYPGPLRWIGGILWVVAGWTLVALLVSRYRGS